MKKLVAYIPKPNFMPVAISDCKLYCKHCMGKYLKQMVKIYSPDDLLEFLENYRGNGILVSGGFDKKGRLINLGKILKILSKHKNNLYVAIHPGFINKKLAKEIAETCDIAFVDLPSNNAIKKVLNLNATIEDYFKNMDLLIEQEIKISPHITLGLNYGKIEEYEILDRLKNYEIEKLVLNIVVPTVKTEFEKIEVKKEEIIDFVKEATKSFNIAIGCMRPRKYDDDLIKVANEIANPSKRILKYVKEIRNYCCGIKEIKTA